MIIDIYEMCCNINEISSRADVNTTWVNDDYDMICQTIYCDFEYKIFGFCRWLRFRQNWMRWRRPGPPEEMRFLPSFFKF